MFAIANLLCKCLTFMNSTVFGVEADTVFGRLNQVKLIWTLSLVKVLKFVGIV